MSDFDFDSALQAQVARQNDDGEAPAEATEDMVDILQKYGSKDDDVVVSDDTPEDFTDDDIVEDEVDEDEEPARDEKGRFTPKDDDPLVKEYLEAFNGDFDKALKSAAHQTNKIGEQGKELGELRQMVAQLQQMQLAQQQQALTPQPQVIAPGQFDEAIEEDPAAVVHWAFENGQEAVYEEAVAAWYEVDPKSAARFERAIEIEALKEELSHQAPAKPDPSIIISQLNTKYSDFAEVVSTATPQELEGLDRDTVEALEARNPTAAFEMVYRWVKASRPASAVAVSQDETEAAERAAEATRTAKRDASAVARGTSRPASGDNSTMERLKESMLSPDPFNVQHGLHSAG